MIRSFSAFLAIILLSIPALAQKIRKSERPIVDSLEAHVRILSDDRMEGRRAGTAGEMLAAEYISAAFQRIGVEPKGTKGYYQPFDIFEGMEVTPSSHLFIEDRELKLNDDYFPLVFSPDASIEALPAIAVNETDMPWFLDLSETLQENAGNPHFDIYDFLKNKAAEIEDKGATALFVYNSSAHTDGIEFQSKSRPAEKSAIPVVYIQKNVARRFFSDESASLDIKMKIQIEKKKRTGHNVIGFINNNAPVTVVLGAHFDHLGYGEDNNSMYRGGEKMIHNGADDNASGTSVLIELARMLKESKLRGHNYLFIAFSGEELGLFGSKYFVDNPTIDLSKVNFMINMDMVGRLDDNQPVLTIGGYGTSPSWAPLIVDKKKAAFKIKVDTSGTGPSDHTSFYRKDIPVLFYFTGLHQDYHKPGDDFQKLNYTGQFHIMKHIYGVIDELNASSSRLVFTPTREQQTTTSARFSVSLGIMPDYTFSGEGVRVDGVSEGRAAQKAGIKAGDIITGLGEMNITSMETYMQALSKFKKGDSTSVRYRRGDETHEAAVQF